MSPPYFIENPFEPQRHKETVLLQTNWYGDNLQKARRTKHIQPFLFMMLVPGSWGRHSRMLP